LCNGIQHLASIMRDLELGIEVNLASFDIDEEPHDIYTRLVEPINKAINEEGLRNKCFYSLQFVALIRKIIKKLVMTKVYAITVFGLDRNLKEILVELNDELINDELNLAKLKKIITYDLSDEEIEKLISNELTKQIETEKHKTYIAPSIDNKLVFLTPQDIYKIAQIINEEIFVIFPSLNNIYSYFTNITRIMTELGIPLTWITPTGMEITQRYLKSETTRVGLNSMAKRWRKVLRKRGDKVNNTKQIQVIIPNVIHSMDSSYLINLINTAYLNNFKPVITIHDCFGTHPNKMGQLEYNVKKEFVLLYSQENFLEKFHNRIIQSILDNNKEIITKDNKKFVLNFKNNEIIELEIPEIPKLSELDINKIINSKYMIS